MNVTKFCLVEFRKNIFPLKVLSISEKYFYTQSIQFSTENHYNQTKIKFEHIPTQLQITKLHLYY